MTTFPLVLQGFIEQTGARGGKEIYLVPVQAACWQQNLSSTATIGGTATLNGDLSVPSGRATIGGPVSAGAVASSGAISATGGITASGDLSGNNLYAAAAPGYNITGSRVAAWLETATGRLGMAASSARFKRDIVPANLDPAAILGLQVKHYRQRAEVAKQDAAPAYHVPTEIGMIAEDLQAAGLWEFIIWEHDDAGALVVDENGEPVPFGIHYELLALAVLAALQDVAKRVTVLETPGTV